MNCVPDDSKDDELCVFIQIAHFEYKSTLRALCLGPREPPAWDKFMINSTISQFVYEDIKFWAQSVIVLGERQST
jgi:hypothetical protein